MTPHRPNLTISSSNNDPMPSMNGLSSDKEVYEECSKRITKNNWDRVIFLFRDYLPETKIDHYGNVVKNIYKILLEKIIYKL